MEFAKENCQLILLGRNSEKLSLIKSEIAKSTGNKYIEIIAADFSELKSVKQAVLEVKKKYAKLDALVNVAAIFKTKRVENSLGLEYMFATNHLGPFILTNELLDLLKAGKPSRVVTVSAPLDTKINFDDLQGKEKFTSGFLGAFGASKMMNQMFTFALARRLEGTGVSTSLFHPGLVKSDLTNEMPAILNGIFKIFSSKPDKAVKMLCRLAINKAYEKSNGAFFKVDGKEIKASSYSLDKNNQEKLWEVSEQLAK